ncbi:hypothetical protein K5I29_04040 [Flavobacterium agricola]|uniref:Zinc ribbon domain-containing protein n=1 Tax=Flavobacterium agricola TaxID=2870839 RepID=A0ABY6M307_9FLAO|nr:hypothetical protein [Flavobacterium agricola]UYW02079.1 hypothetical protein K5I29_04040 [Flavobacterium agricola]
MALIKCKECNNEVSSKAKNCPSCGVKIKKNSGCLGWGLAILVLIFIGYVIEVSTKDTSNTSTNSYSDSFQAYRYAEDAVKSKLKSPATAEFPGRNEKYSHVSYIGDGEYKVNSWVDSQNSFGAMIRSNFSVTIVMKDGTINYKDLTIEQ